MKISYIKFLGCLLLAAGFHPLPLQAQAEPQLPPQISDEEIYANLEIPIVTDAEIEVRRQTLRSYNESYRALVDSLNYKLNVVANIQPHLPGFKKRSVPLPIEFKQAWHILGDPSLSKDLAYMDPDNGLLVKEPLVQPQSSDYNQKQIRRLEQLKKALIQAKLKLAEGSKRLEKKYKMEFTQCKQIYESAKDLITEDRNMARFITDCRSAPRVVLDGNYLTYRGFLLADTANLIHQKTLIRGTQPKNHFNQRLHPSAANSVD